MKKITVLALVALTLSISSCKKDRRCTCIYNKTGSSSTSTEVTTYIKVTKKSALATCNSGSSYEQNDPYNVETRDCVLD